MKINVALKFKTANKKNFFLIIPFFKLNIVINNKGSIDKYKNLNWPIIFLKSKPILKTRSLPRLKGYIKY